MGYRIIKFEVFPNLPGTTDVEDLMQVFLNEQTSVPTVAPSVDFTSSDLLAAAFVSGNAATQIQGIITIFDNVVFNQDIFVTHTDAVAAKACNYYIELEVIPLTDHAAEFTTLKDIRGRNTTP